MDDIKLFAEGARRFERWIHESQSEGSPAAREALRQLVALYSAGLDLPSAFLATTETDQSPRLDDAEVDRVRTWCARLPFDLYGEVFDSTVMPPEEPVIGSIGDDIADIYRDVATGLRLFDAGQFDAALWEWGFNFRIHWGQHATDAILAIHIWLASNEPDQLARPEPRTA